MSVHEAAKLMQEARIAGLLAQFDDVPSLIEGCEKVRDAGYKKWDAHASFPVHGLNDAMGLRATRLPYFVFLCGLMGCGLALLMQWWMNAVDYPYIISGKPIFSLPANVPIIFELTVLISAFGTFFGMFAANGLPRYHHPLFYSERFQQVTTDKFFIFIDSADPRFDESATRALLESLNTAAIEAVEVDE
jgi:hypothetical protein